RTIPFERYERWAETGITAITTPETRWARRDIKSTSLLANVLAKQQAKEAKAFEAWFVDAAGFVTEGSSTTAWIVDANGARRTAPLSPDIRPGITRAEVIPLARQSGAELQEKPFTVAEAKAAKEAFLTSATTGVLPIVAIDGTKIGTGKPGPVAIRLRQAY